MNPTDAPPERIWLHQQPTLGGHIVTRDGYFSRGSKDLEGATEYVRADLAAPAGQGEATWIVSVVMVKHGRSVVNTQNKLYELCAASRDEAQGKAIKLAQSDFPEHYLHTVCGIDVSVRATTTPSPTSHSLADCIARVANVEELERKAYGAPDKGEVARRLAAAIQNYYADKLPPQTQSHIASIIEAELGGQP